MAVSRRTMLLATGPVLAGGTAAAAGLAPGVAVAAPVPGAGFVPAPDLGISPDNSAATNRANLVAALAGSAPCVLFPPGDYQVDNQGKTGVVVGGFGGQLVMQPGARLVFTDNTTTGLLFEGGTGARLDGLSTTFATAPTARQDARECVWFHETTDTCLTRVRIDGSAAAGLLFAQCVRPRVVDALITNTMADGLHFANCRDGRADHVTTVNTADDGVAFVNYADRPDATGGLATNLSVTQSRSRGVAVVGQSGVTIRDVTVDGTAGHGLYCGYEEGWNTRVPTDVRFERARVSTAGSAASCGVRVNLAGTVTVTAVTVDGPGVHGVFVTDSQVQLIELAVRNAPGSGYNLQRSTCLLDRVSAQNTNGIGLFASGCDRLSYGTLTLRDTALTHTTHRVLDVEGGGYVVGGTLWISGTQQPANGYVVGAYGKDQHGSLGTIVAALSGRDIVLDNPYGLAVTRL